MPDFTWHHHQDTGRMQLPPTEIHGAVKNIGWECLSEGQ
ncbi:HNH endonuclease [Massilia antarctica]